jgi:hypothetical protein
VVLPHDLDRAAVEEAIGEAGFRMWRLGKGIIMPVGTVKFFNVNKGLGSFRRTTAAKTCSYTRPRSSALAWSVCAKGRR